MARALGAKIRRAVIVATLGGWTVGSFAALTLLTSLFSLAGLLLGAGMAVVAYFEFRGARELRRLDPSAPRRLALNQLAFAGMLFIYAAISLWTSLHGPNELAEAAASDPQMAQMLAPFESLTRTIYIAVYATMMVLALLGPGLTALYYSSRTKHIDTYIRQTPQWILDLQRAGLSL